MAFLSETFARSDSVRAGRCFYVDSVVFLRWFDRAFVPASCDEVPETKASATANAHRGPYLERFGVKKSQEIFFLRILLVKSPFLSLGDVRNDILNLSFLLMDVTSR